MRVPECDHQSRAHSGLLLIIGALAALTLSCSGSGDDDERPVVVESAFLQPGDFDSCDVVGTVLNTDGEKTCDVFVSFNAFDSFGTIIADGIDSVSNLPPNTRANYVATLLDANGDFVSCDAIERFELAELSQFCD